VKLRVLSYNIHKGFTAGGRAFVLDGIREAIRAVDADLVLLQEVLGDGGPTAPQFEYLADRLWPHFAYGRNAVHAGGHHGNAILSRFPFSYWENIDVTARRRERRGLLHGVIEIPRRRPLHAICVHLGLLEAERRSQVEHLCRRIAEHVPADEALVIGGDFNDWRGGASRALLSRAGATEAFEMLHGTAARTFPSRLPLLRLDRLYARGLRPVSAVRLHGPPWNALSDHVPLAAEYALNEKGLRSFLCRTRVISFHAWRNDARATQKGAEPLSFLRGTAERTTVGGAWPKRRSMFR
jgi:endonuclease/exonuclease/phosphatase family metal-dependent hydrolase